MKDKRFLTINAVIRKYTIETDREGHLLDDETEFHDVERVRAFSDAVRRGFPDAKITWAFSWQALHDPTSRYEMIRALVLEYHRQFGDAITFIPGGYFANVYNTREQINRDISDALRRIESEFDHYRPRSLVAGFLSADNILYAREQEGIEVVQGNIWSQYGIDGQDADGSISYPYYPSKEHFCKPAQSKDDFIDCLNLDGWTVDLVAARLTGDYWDQGVRYVSRMGVGPLETIHTFGHETGLLEMQHTTTAHFCIENVMRNPFAWVTNTYEISEATKNPDYLSSFSQWLNWIKISWPDVRCITLEEFSDILRVDHPDNTGLRYVLKQKGTGIGASYANQEVTWHMNSQYRLGIVRENEETYVFDYTDYTRTYHEPDVTGERNWTLYGDINQKQTRVQDRPQLIHDFEHRDVLT